MERMGPTCTHVPVSNKDEGFFKNLIQTFVLFVRVLLQGMSQLLGEERGE